MPTTRQAPYRQSRSALREIYGTRSIDGSAPQSARDATPSGRLRYLEGATDATPSGRMAERMQSGMTPKQAQAADTDQWRRQFPNEPQFAQPAQGPMAPPLGRLAAAGPADIAQPDDILKAYSQGAVSGVFKTPYGPVSFNRDITPALAPINTASPIPAQDLSQFVPTGLSAPLTPPWKQNAKPAFMSSVFGGASRWT